MIIEIVFFLSLFLYVMRSYLSRSALAFDKSVFESAEILSDRLREGRSLENALDFLSKSDIRCKKLFEYIFQKVNDGDSIDSACFSAAEKYRHKPVGRLAKIIGVASKYSTDLSGVFLEFYKDMKSAYFIEEERKEEFGTESFLIFFLGSVLAPVTVVLFSQQFGVIVPVFIVTYLFVQSFIFYVASALITAGVNDAAFRMFCGVSITMLIVKYGLGVGVL
ncbi:MAG: hypothetical protein U9P44_02915 [archaeon]|nr:hypothetical protein [archaeon]